MDDNYDVDGIQVRSELTSDGRFELPDPVPMAPPVGYKAEPSIIELIRSMVRREVSLSAMQEGYETFEESDDFDIEDDPLDPLTPYEKVFEPPAPVPEVTLKTPLPAAPGPVTDGEKTEPEVASPPAGSPEPTTPSSTVQTLT